MNWVKYFCWWAFFITLISTIFIYPRFSVGRYQLVEINNIPYVIDTVTGTRR